MKNSIIFTAFLLLVCTTYTHAQPNFFIGPVAGINVGPFVFSEGFQNEYTQYYYPGGSYNKIKTIGFQGGLRTGLQFGEGFWIFIEPAYFWQKPGFETADPVEEKIPDAKNPAQTVTKKGIRTWQQSIGSINVPLLARVRLFGDDFGMTATGGLSFNTNITGVHESNFSTEDGKIINGSEKYLLANGTLQPADEYPQSGKALRFGKGAFDHYTDFSTALILSPGFFYNVDERIKITLDWRWSLGLKDFTTQKRKDYLSSEKQVDIIGVRKLRSGILQVGVEMCIDCDY